MSRTLARRAAVLACASAVAIPLITNTPATADPAATAAENGLITYTHGAAYVAEQDGGNPRPLVDDDYLSPQVIWSPDGSRFAFIHDNWNPDHPRLIGRRADGTGEVVLVDSHENGVQTDISDPVWAPNGRAIIYVDFTDGPGRLHYVSADGKLRGRLFPPDGEYYDFRPTVAPDGTVVFVREGNELWAYPPGADEPELLFDSGADVVLDWPRFSVDGQRIAYWAVDRTSGEYQMWVAAADLSQAVKVYSSTEHFPFGPIWAPDGSAIAYSEKPLGSPTAPELKTIDIESGEVTSLGLDGVVTSWQPVVDNDVVRIWGQDHVETAIAASQMNFGTDAADSVVLSRDDRFDDALVGSAFAINENAPLLVTDRATLDPRVEREINRVLPSGATVYLLGGELALSPAVERRLVELGYAVERVWGATQFDTAIAINERISTDPHTAIITTGANFYDALAAGAAAGANPGTVIVLTDGPRMPDSSAAYLDGLDPDPNTGTAMVTAGGPGDEALEVAYQGDQLPSWPNEIEYWPLVGANERDTAVQIAEFFFAAPTLAGVATNRTWFDALAGGALIGSRYGPLLITEPTGLYPGVRDYLSTNAGNMAIAAMFGGTTALPQSLADPIGDAISLPGRWNYTAVQPGSAPVTTPLADRDQTNLGPKVGAGQTPTTAHR